MSIQDRKWDDPKYVRIKYIDKALRATCDYFTEPDLKHRTYIQDLSDFNLIIKIVLKHLLSDFEGKIIACKVLIVREKEEGFQQGAYIGAFFYFYES